MPTLEAPVVSDWPVPPQSPETYGQFVLFSFDPLASVAVFEDDEAREAAAAFPRTRHLAMVSSMGRMSPMNEAGRNLLTLEFHLLGHGLQSDEDGRASIPVAPEVAHPLHRSPIVPSTPLPWPNCYIYSLYKFQSLVSRVHYDPTKAYPYILLDQRRDIFLQALKDQHESDLRQQSNNPPVPLPGGSVSEEEGCSAHSSTYESESSESAKDDNPELTALYNKVEDVQPYVEIWTDLSSVGDAQLLAKPADILVPLDWLKETTAGFERRLLAKMLAKPETGEWVLDMAGGADAVPEPESLADDDVLQPGDTTDRDGRGEDIMAHDGVVPPEPRPKEDERLAASPSIPADRDAASGLPATSPSQSNTPKLEQRKQDRGSAPARSEGALPRILIQRRIKTFIAPLSSIVRRAARTLGRPIIRAKAWKASRSQVVQDEVGMI